MSETGLSSDGEIHYEMSVLFFINISQISMKLNLWFPGNIFPSLSMLNSRTRSFGTSQIFRIDNNYPPEEASRY